MKTLILFLLFTAVVFGQPRSGIKVPLPTSAPTLIIGQSSNNAYDGVSLANFRDTVGIGWKVPADYGIAGDSTDESTELSTMWADIVEDDIVYIPTGDFLGSNVADTIKVRCTLIGDGLKNSRMYKVKLTFTKEVQISGISFEDVTGSAITINPLDTDADSSEGTIENVVIQECGFFRNTFRGFDYPPNPEDTIYNFKFLNNVGDGGGVGKALIYFRGSFKKIILDNTIAKNFLNYGMLIGDEHQDATTGKVIVTNSIIDSIINATSGEAHGILVQAGDDVIISQFEISNVWNDDDTDSEGVYWKADKVICSDGLLHNAGYGDGAIASKGTLAASDFYTNDVSISDVIITYDRPPRTATGTNGIYANGGTSFSNIKIQADTTGISGISIKSATGNINIVNSSIRLRDGTCMNIDMNTSGNDTTVSVTITGGSYQSENNGIQFNANYGVDYVSMDNVTVTVDSGFAVEYLGAGELFKISGGIIRSNTRTGTTSTIFIDNGMERVVIDNLDMFIGSAQTFKPLQLRANINKVTNTDFYYSGNVVSILQIDAGTPALIEIEDNEFIIEDEPTDAPTYFIDVSSATEKAFIKNNKFIADTTDPASIAIYWRTSADDLIVSGNYGNTYLAKFLNVVAANTVTNLEYHTNHWEEKSDPANFYDVDVGATVTNAWIYDNIGYITSGSGTATLVNGQTSIAVAHGLDITPLAKNISVTPIETLASASFWWVDTIGATNITVNVNADPTQDVDFVFQIIDKGER